MFFCGIILLLSPLVAGDCFCASTKEAVCEKTINVTDFIQLACREVVTRLDILQNSMLCQCPIEIRAIFPHLAEIEAKDIELCKCFESVPCDSSLTTISPSPR